MGVMSPRRFERLLRWYPARWRARYGDELVALMEDTFGEGDVPLAKQLNVARAGLSERLHEIGLGADGGAPAEQVRSGSLLVLCAWALFVAGGAAFAKMSEHWQSLVPRGAWRVPSDAYVVVQTSAAVGLIVVVVGGIISLPAQARFFRDSGWTKVRRVVGLAAVTVVPTALLTLGTALFVHDGSGPRDGVGTQAVGALWALLVVASLVTCTAAAIAVAKHLQFSPSVLFLEGLLAMILAILMITIFGAVVAWTLVIANGASALLVGSGSGLFGVPGLVTEIITAVVMLAGLSLAAGGGRRVSRSIRAVSPHPPARSD